MLKVYTATEAKSRFMEIIKEAEDEPLLITRRGKPSVVILSASDYESLLETVKFYSYPQLAKALEKWNKEG